MPRIQLLVGEARELDEQQEKVREEARELTRRRQAVDREGDNLRARRLRVISRCDSPTDTPSGYFPPDEQS